MAFRNKFLKQSDCASNNRYLKESDTDNNFRYLNTAARECNAPLGEGAPAGPTGPPPATGDAPTGNTSDPGAAAPGFARVTEACTAPAYMRDALAELCNELLSLGTPISMFAPICENGMFVDLFSEKNYLIRFNSEEYPANRAPEYSSALGANFTEPVDAEFIYRPQSRTAVPEGADLSLFLYLTDLQERDSFNTHPSIVLSPNFEENSGARFNLKISRTDYNSTRGEEDGTVDEFTIISAEVYDRDGNAYDRDFQSSVGDIPHANIASTDINEPLLIHANVRASDRILRLTTFGSGDADLDKTVTSRPANGEGETGGGDTRPYTAGNASLRLGVSGTGSAGAGLALTGSFPGNETAVQDAIVKFHNIARKQPQNT